MAGIINVRIDRQDSDRLERTLSFGTLVGGDYRSGMEQLGRDLYRDLIRRTPIKTGHLRRGVNVRLDSGPVPRFLNIESASLSNTGVNYGAILDTSSRTHYRAGPLTGQPTQGWWTKQADTAGRLVDAMLTRVAGAIERNFASGVR